MATRRRIALIEMEEERASLSIRTGREGLRALASLDEVVLGLCHNDPQGQGSEYPSGGDPAGDARLCDCERNLRLPGVTRGRRLVVSLGAEGAGDRRVKGSRAGGGGRSSGWLRG